MNMRRSSNAVCRRAFTIVELFVVIAILLIVVAIAVPSFTAVLASSERSLAENSLRAAVTVARDISIADRARGDGALVFMYGNNGRLQMIPAMQVATIQDSAPEAAFGDNVPIATAGDLVERDVFVPVPEAEPIEMPGKWMVRGYAPAYSMVDGWYNNAIYENAVGEANWVFPETSFYDERSQSVAAGARTPRQSFMIRFERGTGIMRRESTTALFVDVRPSVEDRNGFDSRSRLDRADDLERWVARIAVRTDLDGTPGAINPRDPNGSDLGRLIQILGSRSNDTVLVRSVSRVALYNEDALAGAIGATGLNDVTGTLYAPVRRQDETRDNVLNDADASDEIAFALSLVPDVDDADVLRRDINNWIEGDTNPRVGSDPIGNGEFFDEDDQPQAIVFVVEPYTGDLTEVKR